jgi:hypothetical protein
MHILGNAVSAAVVVGAIALGIAPATARVQVKTYIHRSEKGVLHE